MDNNIITELDEQRVDELLEYTTGYSERNAENIKKLFMQKTAKKRSLGRRMLLAAAIAAVTVALSGMALAVSGVIDFGAFYNSIFNSKEAAPYVKTGNGIAVVHNEGDVSVEMVAAYFEPTSHLYIELRLTDLTGAGRLSNSLDFLWDNGYISDLSLATGEVKVNVIDENTVVAGLLVQPYVQGRTISFDRIVTDFETIAGNWEFAISSENVLQERVIYGEFEGHDAELFLGGTHVQIRVFADFSSEEFPYTNFPYDFDSEDAVTILLDSGTTVHPRFSGSMVDSMMASFSYSMDFIKPEDIVSVTFCGTTIAD